MKAKTTTSTTPTKTVIYTNIYVSASIYSLVFIAKGGIQWITTEQQKTKD